MRRALSKWITVMAIGGIATVTFGQPYAHENIARYDLGSNYAIVHGFVEDRAVVMDKSGYYGYINNYGQQITHMRYSQALDFSEGLAQFTYTNESNPAQSYYGYINTSGQEAIAIAGEAALNANGEFSNGVALVVSDTAADKFIDTSGATLLEVSQPHSGIGSLSDEGLILIEDDTNAHGNFFGYMDLSGNMVIPYSYQDAGEFNNWVAPVKKDGLWGYVDAAGATVIPFSYLSATEFSDDGVAFVGGSNGKKALINKFEQGLTGFEYDGVGEISEGYAVVSQGEMTTAGFKGYYGYIDIYGNQVLPMIYNNAQPFSEGLAAVELNGKWGYIDALGNTVIDFVYDYATPFDNGNASAKLGENWYILAPSPIR
ncbi:WG repeat-containing protein [Candidatus Epulonipiscium viviparus]|uniref:WG repeat-containing protein n=1 Tax=Candidatus Epulonipiscium viviparus TaxID=420336 RepID=UPI0027380580|nr:WG repeat-containing protein [Candidatus Epulopiscium viviparus]